MMIKTFRTGLVYSMLIVFFSCEELPSSPCSSDDPNCLDSYLSSPIIESLQLWNYNAIKIEFDRNDDENIENIIITRELLDNSTGFDGCLDPYESGDGACLPDINPEYSEGDDINNDNVVSFIVPYPESDNYIIDNPSVFDFDYYQISPGSGYKYIIEFDNSYPDESDPSISDPIYNTFSGISNLTASYGNNNSVNLEWAYNPGDYYEGYNYETEEPFDFIDFKIIQYVKNAESEWVYESEIIESMEVVGNNIYAYNQDSGIVIGDEYKFDVSVIFGEQYFSNNLSVSVSTDFPTIDIVDWLPIDSKTVALYWKIDMGDFQTDIAEVTITRTLTSNNSANIVQEVSNQSEGYFIDFIDGANPNELIEYGFEWCNEEGTCDNENKYANTFPFENMRYFPAMSQIESPFNGELYSIDAFYIDIYEAHHALYIQDFDLYNTNPDLAYTPVDSLTFEDAKSWSMGRSSIYSFDLPSELEWYVAASIDYDLGSLVSFDQEGDAANMNFDDIYPLNNIIYPSNNYIYYNYPEVVGNGNISCSYANFLGCNGISSIVGTYQAVSPTGLYDCSGNLKEWVQKTDELHLDEREILMGGDFLSSENNIKSSSYVYEQGDVEHRTIGFRTVLPAEAFLSQFKGVED